MDRFIDFAFTNPRTKMIILKSNMDRFIDIDFELTQPEKNFKIQYG